MPRQSETGNVKKICGCVKWKECAHPWYVDYREGKEVGPNGQVRERGLRSKLAPLVGREPVDFADAKAEARRAIVAWKDGRDARELLPGDAPTLADGARRVRQAAERRADRRYQRGPIVKTVVNGRPFGDVARGRRHARDGRGVPAAAAARWPAIAIWRCCGRCSIGRCSAGWCPSTPFKVGTVSAVKLAREEARTRRLQPGEEERLLLRGGRAPRPHRGGARDGLPARRAAVAAVAAGARGSVPAGGEDEGEEAAARAHLHGAQAVLDARRNDPAGDPLPPDAFVFGDEMGRRRGSIKTAWRLTCQRAKIVGLHFHDLRREAGSRWMDAGVPLATIQRWLGHHNISQTSTYLAASGGGDADAMRAFEQATGRLPQVAASAGSNGLEPTSSDQRRRPKRLNKTRSCTNRHGSVCDWGSRGRGFESRHPDQFPPKH